MFIDQKHIIYRFSQQSAWMAFLVFNSLAAGGFDYSLKLIKFKLISTINTSSIFREIALRWMPQHLTDH